MSPVEACRRQRMAVSDAAYGHDRRRAADGTMGQRDVRASKMHLPWLHPGDPFPDPSQAWDARQPAPGLLAAGGALDVDSLQRAYASAIFPWFSEGQPI